MKIASTRPRPGQLSRRSVLRGVGATGLLALTTGSLVLGAPGTALAAQDNWRYCVECQGLWFNGNPNTGACPATASGHTSYGSGDYNLKFSYDGGGDQDNWRWCTYCAGLWFAGNSTTGACPAFGGARGHTSSGSGDYLLNFYPNGGGNQDQWIWCAQCQGLWFGGDSTGGVCPAPDTVGHDRAGSGDYFLTYV